MKLLPQHISSLLYVNIGRFISPISREDGSALASSTQRGFSPVVVATGTLKETQKRCQADKPHLLLSFCGIYLIPGGLKSSTKIQGDGCSPLPFQCLLQEAPKGFASALWNCVHQSQGSDQVLLFLSFKQPTCLIYLHWLQIWLARMLTEYQNLITADEMNRNKEVWKYLKINHLS